MSIIKRMVTCYINDIPVTVPKGTTILQAAAKVGMHIPTLCHLDLHDIGVVNRQALCRICVVEDEKRELLVPSCAQEVTSGQRILTDSKKAIMARRINLELLLSNHPQDCLMCVKNLDCELQSLAHEMNIRQIHYPGEKMNHPIDDSSFSIFKNPNKCIMCRRCITMCDEMQTVGVLSAVNRGFDSTVSTAFHLDLQDTSCTYCGQCASVCPTAALAEKDSTPLVWREINHPTKHVSVQVAPAVRVAIAEAFGQAPGTISTGKLVMALRRLGFDSVFDTNFAADLTVIEEAHEFVERVKAGGRLPMLTSCCPAWVNFIEQQFPNLVDVPSTCKSPQQMMGAITKTYYAKEANIDVHQLVTVAIMPCVAKKAESSKEGFNDEGFMDVDYVLTTRELARMIKEAAIDFNQLHESDFDHPLGESTGAAVIFGTTGGVMEAAIRTAYEMLTGKPLIEVKFESLRGFDGIRSASIDVGGKTLNVAIAHELGNARKLLNAIENEEVHYDLLEIMACPGGCIGGGGQPYHHGNVNIIEKRRQAIYQLDQDAPLRKSHENPAIIQLYEKFLKQPGSDVAHKYLHTHYKAKPRI
jgi:NADH-quinone oxidoreductase subunit G